jgi:hypothetical protein
MMIQKAQRITDVHLSPATNMPMGPEEIRRVTTAYEQALRTIGIVDRGDPLAKLLARKIIEVAQTGIRDPADIAAQASKEIGVAT